MRKDRHRACVAFDPTDSNDSTIWTGSTGQGLFRVNSRGVQRFQAAQGLISDELGVVRRSLPRIAWNSVGSMLVAHDGTIWTAGSEIGVVVYPVHGPPYAGVF